jgi:hypothetical protein
MTAFRSGSEGRSLSRSVGSLRALDGPCSVTAEEVDMVEVGDWVLVESEKVDAVLAAVW